jgi:hypothetical protein
MANYAATALAKAQVKASLQFGASETRALTPSVMALAYKNSSISIPRAEIERVHENRVVDINFFAKTAAGSITAKAYNHTGPVGDSAKVNLSYNTVVEPFSLPMKLANNNVFGYEEMFANKYMQAWQNLVARQDALALALVTSDRCQLTAATLATPLTASGAGSWSDANFALEISQASKKQALQKAEAFMMARYFNGQYDVIADLQMKSEFDFLLNQGAGNNQNTNFQFGNSLITPTQSIISGDYSLGSFFILPKGGLAGVCWNDKMNKQGIDEGRTETGVFTTAVDPFGYGVKADVSMYTKRADTSADTVGGSTEDLVTYVELSLTMAYATNPLTLAGDGVPTLVGITA